MSNQRKGRLKRGDSDDETEGPQVFKDSHGTEKEMKEKQAFTSLRGPEDSDDEGAWPPPPSDKVSLAAYDVPHFGGVTKKGTGEVIVTSGKQSSLAHHHGTAVMEESKETEKLPSREEFDNSKDFAAVSPSGGQSRASVPRSRHYRGEQPSPGAFREGGSTEDDEETVVLREDVQPAPKESDKMHLVAAEVVQDPILVSAAKVSCICCPYGRFTAIPAIFGSLGSGLSLCASLVSCFAKVQVQRDDDYFGHYSYVDCWYTDLDESRLISAAFVLGIVSGSLGLIAFVLSTVMSCKTFPAWVVNILGCFYIIFGIMSLLMLMALSSAVCTEGGGCTLAVGSVMAIIAFFMYVGAGTTTFYMNKKLQTNQPAAPTHIA